MIFKKLSTAHQTYTSDDIKLIKKILSNSKYKSKSINIDSSTNMILNESNNNLH